jgi:hypothetical protein
MKHSVGDFRVRVGARTQHRSQHTHLECKRFRISTALIQNILDYDSLDQNLLDSTVLNAKYFAMHLLRCKIAWISLATVGLVLDRRSSPSKDDIIVLLSGCLLEPRSQLDLRT